MEIEYTRAFSGWLNGLKDRAGRARIQARIDRLAAGNAGDHKRLGDNLYELRVVAGPGYRVYYRYSGAARVILLCGGDKSTQRRDIKRARDLAHGF